MDDLGFERWYRQQHPGLVSSLVVIAAGDVVMAAEAADEAFARAYANWGRVGRMASPGGWTYRTAVNVLRRRYRRARVEATLMVVQHEVIADLDANDPNRQGQALWAPDRVAAYEARPPAEPQGLPSSQLDDGVGYLDLTPLDAVPQSDEGAQYVRHVRSALSATACGWVLDLRAPYPHADSRADTMLSAVAPLLPEGGAFGYRFRDGARNDFAILPDGSISDTADGTMVAPAVGSFTATGVPVAVLQGTGTTASYESLLVAFSGRDGVRTFGEPSAGQPVLRRSFPLSDGSLLWLTTGVAVGHEGDAYGGPIGVDASISSDVTQSRDPAREAAEGWLSQQPSCS